MTDSPFHYHDRHTGMLVEAIQFHDEGNVDLTQAWPSWFIDMLCGTGNHSISKNRINNAWYFDKMYPLEEGDWIVMMPGIRFAQRVRKDEFENQYAKGRYVIGS